MTLDAPKKKDPRRRTRVPTLPPSARSRAALGLDAAAARGAFQLQVCRSCGAVQYPARDACHSCLSVDLAFEDIPRGAEVIAETQVEASPDAYFRQRLPWRLGTVKLDAGPVAMTHLHGAVRRGDRVRMDLRLDRAGRGVLVALPEHGGPDMEDDPALRAMGTQITHRRVLISDARAPYVPALVDALQKAGARHIYLGEAEAWRRWEGREALAARDGVSLMDLDVTDADSLRRLAGEIGGKVEIIINTARYLRPGGVLAQAVTEAAREMDVNALGLMRLAQAFGPALMSRSDDGPAPAATLVQVLDVNALSPDADVGFAASQAAARALMLGLRTELGAGGVRVMAAYTGPTDDEWHQPLPPPKVAPRALARAIVAGLTEGREEVAAGDVADDITARWRDDPEQLDRDRREGNL